MEHSKGIILAGTYAVTFHLNPSLQIVISKKQCKSSFIFFPLINFRCHSHSVLGVKQYRPFSKRALFQLGMARSHVQMKKRVWLQSPISRYSITSCEPVVLEKEYEMCVSNYKTGSVLFLNKTGSVPVFCHLGWPFSAFLFDAWSLY